MPLEKQLSVFVANKVGALSELCHGFNKANVNIKAMSIVDDLDWGMVKLIVDDPDGAKTILQGLGLMFGEGHVVTIEIDNQPGALALLAEKLARKKINIEQAYATAAGDKTLVVLSTTDDKKSNAILSG